MLIEVDGVDAHAEDDWVRHQVRIGSALVEWHGHVGRCVTTTRDPGQRRGHLPHAARARRLPQGAPQRGAAPVRDLRRGAGGRPGPGRRRGRGAGPMSSSEQRVGRRGRRPRRGGHADATGQAQRARRGDVRADHRRRRPPGRRGRRPGGRAPRRGPELLQRPGRGQHHGRRQRPRRAGGPRARRGAQLVSARRARVARGSDAGDRRPARQLLRRRPADRAGRRHPDRRARAPACR